MKSKILFLLLFVSSFGFSQSVNDYAGVIVPLRFDFLKSDNQYRTSTITKANLKKAGFEAFYTNEVVSNGYNDRCSMLNVDVVKDNGFLVTKLFVVLKDCNGKEIYKSEVGKSKEKDYELAYTEALNMAFQSVYALGYKYNGKAVANSSKESISGATVSPTVAVASKAAITTTAAVAVNVPTTNEEPDGTVLFAQPIKNGFQLVDNTPKVVIKVYKTTNPSIYLAVKESLHGVAILKDNQWYFEYYDKETLMSEKIKVKF
jgi:hypothetical protein